MERKDEARNAALEIFKDSEYPVPNTFSFLKGVEWADSNPLFKWIKVNEKLPKQGQVVLIAIPNLEFKIVSYQVMKFDYTIIPCKDNFFYWLPVPELILE